MYTGDRYWCGCYSGPAARLSLVLLVFKLLTNLPYVAPHACRWMSELVKAVNNRSQRICVCSVEDCCERWLQNITVCRQIQWRSQRGKLGGSTPHSHRSRFFHSHKVTVIKYYNLSLTTRRTINSHDLRKTNHWGAEWVRLLFASMVECVLTWIREQYLVVCNIAK